MRPRSARICCARPRASILARTSCRRSSSNRLTSQRDIAECHALLTELAIQRARDDSAGKPRDEDRLVRALQQKLRALSRPRAARADDDVEEEEKEEEEEEERRPPRFLLEEKTFDLATHEPEPGFASPSLTYPGLELVHVAPAIWVVHDFFSRDECERLVAKARGRLERSLSYDGAAVDDRTSEVWRVARAME